MENNENEEADMYLKFSDYNYNRLKADIFNITRGDLISYNATILFEGNQKNIPVLEGFEIQKLNEKIYIQPHIHNTGRYSVGHNQIHKDENVYGELPNVVADEELNVEEHQHETHH